MYRIMCTRPCCASHTILSEYVSDVSHVTLRYASNICVFFCFLNLQTDGCALSRKEQMRLVILNMLCESRQCDIVEINDEVLAHGICCCRAELSYFICQCELSVTCAVIVLTAIDSLDMVFCSYLMALFNTSLLKLM